MSLNQRSERNLQGVHPDLVAVVRRAAEKEPFLVTEGLRARERQALLVKSGKSRTLNSRHLTGHAVDLCDTDGCYDIPDMQAIARAMKAAAAEIGTPIEWGGDWKSFVDTPHFQLPFASYPASGVTVPERVAETVSKNRGTVATGAGVGAGLTIPALPAPPDLSSVSAWQTFGDTVSALGSWSWQHPLLTAALGVYVVSVAYLPLIAARLGWQPSSHS